MTITLIGYRGCGKSSVAQPLAEKLGWNWIDADAEVERRAGRTIREIFADDGEPTFRRIEREVIASLLQKEELVLAAGGGAVLDPQTRHEMPQAGPVVWLQASVDILERRIEADRTTADRRPALTEQGGRNEIEQMLTQREPLYRECATLVVQTDTLTVDMIVHRIIHAVAQESGEETSS